ncbi:2-desacetyl-2-hydroxyethyl bacteriochlorophyllide A dehydrogenase [Paenibacillus rhizosphaerae]|uniref:2-desacetyl-2-hydroxyethyl bacteriochlorophyllide A dehydrogenase n=1 Tax=Paenibacillus rhizosphaerae TaxID=297318 RepID=A0A839TP28_9BACL|nr:zinc-binding dehydrogenase [Paenibacillus rhizosphaerae]MBB3128442.1 2-desacetyl-2-hydroxyethyl bacteriochlorophyllide A dehydrogenase [Paenibacillus rhizosphaerae]
MGEVLVFERPRSIAFHQVEEQRLEQGQIRLRTLYSGISAGTQLTAYRGTNPMVSKVPDSHTGLFMERSADTSMYPVIGGWAYEEIGRVEEIGPGVDAVKLGELIYGAWGHRSTHIVTETYARDHKLQESIDPITGIYAQMGAIALNAVLDAHIHIGETAVVFGQGVPGQIAAQLARLNGARVITVDLDDWRLDLSRTFGAAQTINSIKEDAGKVIMAATGTGADVAIELSGFTAGLHQAIRSVVYNGRVVAAGFYQGDAGGLFLGEEFHHRRIQVISSQIGNVSVELQNRWNRLRLERTVFRLAASGLLNLKGLITHVVPFKEAAAAYEMIDRKTEPHLQVVLSFE